MDSQVLHTSKEKFDQVMDGVKTSLNHADDVPDEDVDEVGKNMRDEKLVSDAKESGQVINLQELQQSTLGNLSQLNQARRKSHLSSEDTKILKAAFDKFEHNSIDHPVLLHLFEAKLKLAKDYVTCGQKAKQLYQDMLKQMSVSSEENLKILGAIENVDKQIIEILKTDGQVDLPPSA